MNNRSASWLAVWATAAAIICPAAQAHGAGGGARLAISGHMSLLDRPLLALGAAGAAGAGGAAAAGGISGTVGTGGVSIGGGVFGGAGAPLGGGGAPFGGGATPFGGGGGAFGGGLGAFGGGLPPLGGSLPVTPGASLNTSAANNAINSFVPGVATLNNGRQIPIRFGYTLPFYGNYGGYGLGTINSGFGAPAGVPALNAPPLLQPPVVHGPMEVHIHSPNAIPRATMTREVFVNGTPQTVSAPVVTDYYWPATGKHGLARTIKHKLLRGRR